MRPKHHIQRNSTSAGLFGSPSERGSFERAARVRAAEPQTAAFLLETTPYIFCTITIKSGC